MAGQLPKPGVRVGQRLRKATPTSTRPTLIPCVVGPAFEVVPILTEEGTINEKARYGAYEQVGRTITQSSFPDPRGNIDELNILEETVRPFLATVNTLSELVTSPGSSFLCTSHGATRAAIRTVAFGAGLALAGRTLQLAFDVYAENDTSRDVLITFSGAGSLTNAQAAAQINTAVGTTVAYATTIGPDAAVLLVSPTCGAGSSITVRAGGTANSLLGIGYETGAARHERVVGGGYCIEDDGDQDVTSPWVKFSAGGFYAGTTYPLAKITEAVPAKMGTVKAGAESTDFDAQTAAAAPTFGSGGTVPIKVGDHFYADGVRVNGAEVMKVELNRFKLGTINDSLSVTDENGRYLSKVYDPSELPLLAVGGFAPKWAYFVANGLSSRPLSSVPSAAKLVGAVDGTAASVAYVTSTLSADPAGGFLINGLRLHLVVTVDGVENDYVHTFVGGPYPDMASVVTDLTGQVPGVLFSVQGAAPAQLRIATVKSGRLQGVVVKADGTANGQLGFADDEDTGSDVAPGQKGADIEVAGLAGKVLSFVLDESARTFEVPFSDNSLELAVEEINSTVGAQVASLGGDNDRALVLTSTLKGKASSVEVKAAGVNDAAALLGLAGSATGTGRPLPDAYLDDLGNLVIGSQILRDALTGRPLDPSTNGATLFVQYKALRKDVTPSAALPGVVRIPNIDILSEVLDPLTEDNPAGLACFLAMTACPGKEIKFVGVDEITPAAPTGTEAAYARAAAMLEAEEVYSIGLLTDNQAVHQLFRSHVLTMSEPEEGGERIVFISKVMPDHENPTILASGSGDTTTTANQFRIDQNPVAALAAAGIDASGAIPASKNVYLQIAVDGETRRYSVAQASSALIILRTAFAAGENADGFFSTATLNASLVSASYTLNVRGAPLVIPGSNPLRLDYPRIADTVATSNEGLRTRRVYSVFPDRVKVSINGVTKEVPGYYACAALAGLCAGVPPQQGLTNYPIPGIVGVVGPEKFSKTQLDKMAGGGTFILVQDEPGGVVYCRHQVSTDTSSIETRELSITKALDAGAKRLRTSMRVFIGTHNIDETLLDSTAAAANGTVASIVEDGWWRSANLANLVQNADALDELLLDVVVENKYPSNYIRITLLV
jgi:hypothetical protein